MDTKVGLLLGTRGLVMKAQREGRAPDASVMLTLAERAEAAGLNSVWVGDSLLSKPRLEPVAAMSAIAARTQRVRIGTAVLLPAIRHPVTLAHGLATADVIAGGRLVVAAGVGGAFTAGQVQDWTAVGVEPTTRAGRFTEVVQILRKLWTEDHVSFSGRHFKLDDVTLDPKPPQDEGIPLLLATHFRAKSDAQVRRAARYGSGVMGISDHPDEYGQVLAKVDDAARAEGRDPASLDKVFYMTVNINDDVDAAAAEAEDFLVSYYHVSHWGDRWGPWGSPQAIVQKMAAYANAGAKELVVRFASWDQPGQWERFEREVLPAFSAL